MKDLKVRMLSLASKGLDVVKHTGPHPSPKSLTSWLQVSTPGQRLQLVGRTTWGVSDATVLVGDYRIPVLTAMHKFLFYRMKPKQRSQDQGEPVDVAGPRLWSTDGDGKLATNPGRHPCKNSWAFSKTKCTSWTQRGDPSDGHEDKPGACASTQK